MLLILDELYHLKSKCVIKDNFNIYNIMINEILSHYINKFVNSGRSSLSQLVTVCKEKPWLVSLKGVQTRPISIIL